MKDDDTADCAPSPLYAYAGLLLIPAALMVIYFAFPVIFIVPFGGDPPEIIEVALLPVVWLYEAVPAYESWIDWQVEKALD
jgi:hypothetical protein